MSETVNPSGEGTSPQMGECYKRAYERLQELRAAQKAGSEPGLEKAELFLVHGSVVTRAEHLYGKRIDHAWVEMALPGGCVVLEYSTPTPDYQEKSQWIKALQAIEEKRYTPEEAFELAHALDPLKPNSGPWHREPLPPRDP